MHDVVLAPETKTALEVLAGWAADRRLYLAGGTGCALQLGHRMSQDLDFFTPGTIEPSEIQNTLWPRGEAIADHTDSGTWVGRFSGVKAGFFHYPYPMIGAFRTFLGVQIASLEDIGCMKIEAIAGRGKKRDFIDLYFILKNLGFDLEELVGLFRRKYGGEHRNMIHVLKSLVYFDDAETDPDPRMLVEYSWLGTKQFISGAVKRMSVF